MIVSIHPKLPMRNCAKTKNYYTQNLDFDIVSEYPHYLIVKREDLEIHFFYLKHSTQTKITGNCICEAMTLTNFTNI